MANFTKEMIDDLANKLLIKLSPEENKLVLDEFNDIDDNLNLVTQIPGLSEVEPMTHALDDFIFEIQDDVEEESVSIEDILRNADQTDGREIEIVKVVGE